VDERAISTGGVAESFNLGGREEAVMGCLGRDRVGVEVVHDQDDLVRVGVVEGEKLLDAVGPVDAGPGGLGVGATPPS